MEKKDLVDLINKKGKKFRDRVYINLTREPMEMRGEDGGFTVEPIGAELGIPDRERLGDPVATGASKTGVVFVTRTAKPPEVDEETLKALAELKKGGVEVYFMGTPFMLKMFPDIISVPLIHTNGRTTRVYQTNHMWPH